MTAQACIQPMMISLAACCCSMRRRTRSESAASTRLPNTSSASFAVARVRSPALPKGPRTASSKRGSEMVLSLPDDAGGSVLARMSGPPSRAPLTVVKGAFTREDAPGRTQHGPGGKPAADLDLEWSILMAHAQDGDSGAYRRLLQ